LLSIAAIGWAVMARADNPCIPTTTNCGPWSCTTGSVNNPGTLSRTNDTICVGGSSGATLSGTTFNYGQKTEGCSDDCGNFFTYGPYPFTYTATNWWEPPIPATFTTPGTFTFTNKVQGLSTDYDCSQSTQPVVAGTLQVLVISATPVIVTQPADQTVAIGSNATFTVVATGCPTLSYQWKKTGYNLTNTGNVSGATSATLMLTAVKPQDSGIYTVVVSNSAGSVSSLYAVLRVRAPTDVVIWGDNRSGQCNVPWGLTNAVAIAGGDEHTLVLKSNGTVVAWGYNAYGQCNVPSGLSNVVAVIAGTAADHSLALKTNHTLVGWGSDFDGEADPPSGLSNVVAAAAGGYHSLALKNNGAVVVWGGNDFGQTNIPSTATTNVFAIAAGYANSLVLKGDGTVVAWGENNLGQCNVTTNLTNAVAIAAGWYHGLALRRDGTVTAWGWNDYGQTNVPTGLSNVVAIAAGGGHSLALKADGTLVIWGVNGKLDAGQSIVPPGLTNVVAISAGTYNSMALGGLAPVITLQPRPASQTVVQGENAIFDVAATGTAPLNYQWYFNQTNPVVGGTSSTFVLVATGPSVAGNYSVVVTNTFGSATSVTVSVAVIVPPIITAQPTNQFVALGGTVQFVVGVSGSSTPPVHSQWYFNSTNALANATNSSLTLTNVQSSQAGNYSVILSNIAGQVTSSNALLSVIVPPSISVSGQPQSTNVVQGANANISVTASGTTPLSYQWRFNGTVISGASASNYLKSDVQPPDAGNYSVVVTNAAGSVTSSVAVLTVIIPPTIIAQPQSLAIVQGSNATFSVSAIGTTNLNYQWRFNATNVLSGATNASLTITNAQLANAGNYSVIVSNVAGVVASSNATLTVLVPPSIVTQPTNQTVVQGGNASFSVTLSALSTTPLAYQWQFNGANIPGANGSSYAKVVVQPSDAGNYSVVITNAAGSVTSAPASLTVIIPASISTQPANQMAAQGANVTFSVVATGSPSLSYQWYTNGVPLGNGTKYSGVSAGALWVTNVTTPDAVVYSVIVSNSGGSVAGAGALLTVVSLNRIIIDASNPEIQGAITNCLGTNNTLRAMPTPSGVSFPNGYPLWTITSQPPGSALPNNLASGPTASITPTNAGQYTISASCGTSSNTFTIISVDPADTDYDGVGGWQEVLDGTDPTNVNSVLARQLGSWRFDTTNWAGMQGQSPMIASNLVSVPGVISNAVQVSTNGALLIYRETEPNSPIANINCRKGSLSFWFRPDWNSATNGTGPTNEARLFEFGSKGTTNGCWGLYINAKGTNLYFCTQTNSTTGTPAALRTNLTANINWLSNYWRFIAITYTTNSCRLFIDGQPVATNNIGITNWPGLTIRTNGFCIGNSRGGTNQARGRFDILDTCDYQRSDNDIQNQFVTTCFSYVDAMLVMDTSGSMGDPGSTNHTKLQDAKQASTNFLMSLNYNFDKAGLVTFSNLSYPQMALTTNYPSILQIISSLTNAGSTSIYAGITNAQGLLTSTNHNLLALPVMVLLTDGSNNPAYLDTNTIPAAAAAKSNGTHIVTVALGNGADTNLLLQLASSTNLFYYATNSGQLSQIYSLISGLICRATNQPPLVQITSPLDYQVFNAPATIPITATAHDPQNALVAVKFYDGASFLGAVASSSGTTNPLYTLSWPNVTTGGTHALTAVATNEFGMNTTSSVVHVVINLRPTVSAGPNITNVWIEGNSTLITNLVGSVADDGLPIGKTNIFWSVVSSNGSVMFGNQTQAVTAATFNTNGLYVFQLTADDSIATNSSQCFVSIKRRPFVYLTFPTNNATFTYGTSIPINASAYDYDGYVTNVLVMDVFNGVTNVLGTNTPAGGLGITNFSSFAWTNAPAGTNTLMAVATDNDGLSKTSAPVVVAIINRSPTVQITSPTNQTFPARSVITVSATATSSVAGVTISNVQFFAGTNAATTKRFATASSVSSNGLYQVTWRPSFAGTYTLTALATDTQGSNAWSAPVTNTIRNLPIVYITTPTNGQIFLASSTNIPISAQAIPDPSTAITNVTFYQGTNYQSTNVLGVTTSGTSNLFSINYTFTSGVYVLSAKAYDTNGDVSFSTNVTIRVITNQPPAVYAGPDQTVNLSTNPVQLAGIVTDDGLPSNYLVIAWSLLTTNSGTAVFANPANPRSTVLFTNVGVYTLQLWASDGQLSATSTVNITVQQSNLPPVVLVATNHSYVILPALENTNPIGTIKITAITNLGVAAGVDYFAPSNAVIVNGINGNPGFDLIETDGTPVQFTSIPVFGGDQSYFATVKDTNGGFRIGEVFRGAGSSYGGEIIRIEPDGTTNGTLGNSGMAWVILTNATVTSESLASSLWVDQTGVWGGDLIVVTLSGDVWRVNSAGQPTLVAQLQGGSTGYEGATTVPYNVQRYGPWAGKILVGSDSRGPLFAIDTNGFAVRYNLPFGSEDIRIIPDNQNMLGADDAGNLWGAVASEFQGMAGDILISDEFASFLYRLRWNGTAFTIYRMGKTPFGLSAQINFSPAGIPGLPALDAVHLQGFVTDDHHIYFTPTNGWLKVSGPGPVTFDDPSQTNTFARFTTPGTYYVRLSAFDGQYTRYKDVEVDVIRNQPPVVSAGTNFVTSATNATLYGGVSDDGLPYGQTDMSWSAVYGPDGCGAIFGTPNQAVTTVTFTNASGGNPYGTYVFRLTASDGQATRAAEVTVTVGTTNIILAPAYGWPTRTNISYTVFASVVDANNNPVTNQTVQFSIAGANPSTTPPTANTDSNGIASFTYGGASPGRDYITATVMATGQPLTVNNQTIQATVAKDWAVDPGCDSTNSLGGGAGTGSLSVDWPTDDPRYADYYLLRGNAGGVLTISDSDNANEALIVRDPSNNIVAVSGDTLDGSGQNYDELTLMLTNSGDYLIEIVDLAGNVMPSYQLVISCNDTTNILQVPEPQLQVLYNGTSIPSGGAIIFPPTAPNQPTNVLVVITNSGGAALAITSVQTNGDFVLTNDISNAAVPIAGTTNLGITFNASSNGVAIGEFAIANNASLGGYYIAYLVAGAFPTGAPPVVQITSPATNSTFFAPASIPISALATSISTNISYVIFQQLTTNGPITLGTVSNGTGNVFTLTWANVTDGGYVITATAVDAVGRSTTASPVAFQVLPSNGDNPPVAQNDFVYVPAGSKNFSLNPLQNDSDPDGDPLTIIAVTTNRLSGATLTINNGTDISYTPPALLPFGWDSFNYEITDGRGGVAWATVEIGIYPPAPPVVTIVNPVSSLAPYPHYTTNANSIVPITAYVTPSESIAKVDFFLGESFIGEVTNGSGGYYTLTNWTAVYSACGCGINAQATDVFGQVGSSQPIFIDVTNTDVIGSSSQLIASLDSIVGSDGTNALTDLILIRDGLFNLNGKAYYATPGTNISWQLGLYGLDGTPIRILTHPPYDRNKGCTNPVGSSLGPDILVSNCDLTTIANGVYNLTLGVDGGLAHQDVSVRIRLESNLKIGQFTFSQQDLEIPVHGIPLTVTRKYNSLNPDKGDFGFGWTYSLSDMDVQIDEARQDTMAWSDETESYHQINIRTGGGRDITLTLPNGQRTTFYYFPTSPDGFDQSPAWRSAPGVTATLTAQYSPIYEQFYLQWVDHSPDASDDYNVPDGAYDIPGFVLTTLDGTSYIINRQDIGAFSIDAGYTMHVWGKPYLAEIDQLNGDTIKISSDRIVCTSSNGAVKQIVFQRDPATSLITSISDPNGLDAFGSPSGPPAVVYQYDWNQNLIAVDRLVDRTGSGTYVTNSFAYDNPNFPHYITGIFNADGTQLSKNIYDDTGKLIATIDPDGNTTTFIHNTTNALDVVADRLGHTNIYVYDLLGNVVAQTNALNQVEVMAYDQNNNNTNAVMFLNGQPYATNSSLYDNNNLLLVSVNPLGYSNVFNYNSLGQVTNSTDALGKSSTNYYDSVGNATGITDAQGNSILAFYINGLLVGYKTRTGALITNYYDPSSANLTGTVVLDASGSTILSSNTFTYDANDNRLTSTVWRFVNGSWEAATTTHVYDAMDREIQTIDPNGGTNTTVYNALGQVQATIDPLGRQTTHIYDLSGRLVQTTYPDNTAEYSAYDANGNRTNRTDALRRTTSYVYDPLNRLVQTIYPDNTTNTAVYDDLGRLQFSIDARGVTNAFGHDADDRQIAVTNAWGTSVSNVFLYGFDPNGNLVTFTNSLGIVTTNNYDSLSRLTNIAFADGTSVNMAYDAEGHRIEQVDQAGVTNRYGYDYAGRLIAVTNAFGTPQQMITSLGYDEAGNLLSQIDALNHVSMFAYDLMGRRTKRTLPGMQSETFGYDVDGNLLYHTNFNGVVITNLYDSLSRLTNSSSINGYRVAYTYTPTGQRGSMIDPSGSTAYTYDNRDRLITKVVNWTNTAVSPSQLSVSLNYLYDANGNVTNLWSSTPNGVANSYQFDALNRLTNVSAGASSLCQYGFDPVGNLQNMRYGNGITNLYQYDRLNRLTNSIWNKNVSPVAAFAYQIGRTGNWTNLVESIVYQSSSVNRTNSWSYDSLYRLTNETILSPSCAGPQVLSYGYDSVGNRTNRNVLGCGLTLTNQSFTFNSNDWLTIDQYDNDGNTVASSGNTYQYDPLNHVTNANNGAILIGYDGDGNRVSKRVGGTTTYYLVDDKNPSGYVQVVEEWTASTGSPALSKVYAYGLSLVCQTAPGVSTNYFGYDGHGSTRFLSDAGGNVTETFAYDAYGTLIYSNAPPATTYLYGGQQFDPDLGFYYLRERALNPNTGRFLTMDSVEGSEDDPLSLHKYLYCKGSPVMLTDPLGTQGTLVELLATAFTIASEAATTAFELWSAYATAQTIVDAAEIALMLVNGEKPTCGQIIALGINFVPLGKVFKAVAKATKLTTGGKALIKTFYKITGKSGTMGELGAAMAVKMKGFKSVKYRKPGVGINGFDDVVKDGAGNFIIVEAKGGSAQLKRLVGGEQQMSRKWILDNIEKMKNGPQAKLAEELEKAAAQGRIKGMVVKTKVKGKNAFVPQDKIKDWSQIGYKSY